MGAVRWLLSRGGGHVHVTDRFGRSALQEARKKAKLPYPFNHHKVILRLLEAHIDFSDDVAHAQTSREEGNVLFREHRQFKRAAVKYTESLQLAADHRTFSNRSQCYLNIAREHREGESHFQCRNQGKEFYRDLFQRALSDAEAARAMEPLLLKSHHRKALALLGLGAVHRALEALYVGLQSCSAAERSSSNAACMRRMIANLLEKLQMTELDLQERDGRGDSPDNVLITSRSSSNNTSDSNSNVYLGSSSRTDGVPEGGSRPSFSLDEVPSNMCMWCETMLPVSLLQRQEQKQQTAVATTRNLHSPSVHLNLPLSVTTPDVATTAALLCPLCFCNIHDKMSPQVLRDQYLGGSTSTSTVTDTSSVCVDC